MDNPELGRKVLNHLGEHPEQFDMGTFGEIIADCGTVACLAGHTLLQDHYEVDADGFYYDHDGVIVIDEQTEAVFLLGLTDDELGRGTGPVREDDQGLGHAAVPPAAEAEEGGSLSSRSR